MEGPQWRATFETVDAVAEYIVGGVLVGRGRHDSRDGGLDESGDDAGHGGKIERKRR